MIDPLTTHNVIYPNSLVLSCDMKQRERERERETEREREKDRDRDRQTDREGERRWKHKTFANEKCICNSTSNVPEKFGTFLRFSKCKLLHELCV